MKRLVVVLGVIGLLIGCFLPVFSILWELSEIRGACQDCPVNFWKNTTYSDIVNIILYGIVGGLIGGSIGLVMYKLFKK
ncbi:MAG: hypothetical protein IPO21_14795 [Bacteroidales bacterium]|nr:hypothetical protein [Bacteroidales bacterium]